MTNHYIQMSSDQRSLELGEMIPDSKTDGLQSDVLNADVDPIFKNLKPLSYRRLGWEKVLIFLTFIIVLFLLILLIILLISFCYLKQQIMSQKVVNDSDQACLTFTCLQAAVDINKSINTSADPCIDFSQFVCGKWKSDQLLPKGNSRYSTFDVVNTELFKIQKKILENQNIEDKTSSWAKAIRLYNSCINIEKINILGKDPLIIQMKNIYDKYGGWDMLLENNDFPIDKWNLKTLVEDPYVEAPAFRLLVQEDDKNSQSNIFNLHLTWLILERQFLQNTTKLENKKIIDAYKEYMKDVGKLLGVNPKKFEQFNEIMKLETEVAMRHPKEEDLRDPDSMYNKMSISKLQTDICPLFNWTEIVKRRLELVNITLPENIEIIIPAPEHLKQICTLFQSYSTDKTKKLILHNYIMWRFVHMKVNYLSEDFIRVKDKFRKVYVGTIGSKERWELCVNTVQNNMGLVLGNMYITQHFNKKSKPQVLEMINLLKEKFRENLQSNKWMDSLTMKQAIDKIDSMWPIIGYTESILNRTYIEEHFNQVEINNETFYENIYRLNDKGMKRNYQRINKPPDNSTIDTPQEVNAFYNPNKNEIIFPAGILQNPFFEPEFPRSLKYGGIGTAMGHEITHGFDDTGSKYDSRGNLRSWWTNETRSLFKNKSECFIKQYSLYALYGHYINGENTLGENIADNGGVRLTYQVYKDLEKIFGVEKRLPGLKYTHDQLFFITFARLWCNLQTRQSILIDIFSNNHTPNMYRVIGVLSNLKEFADAFNCPVGSPMNPEKKCLVW